MAGKLYCYNPLQNSKKIACINHLVAEIRAIYYYFSSYISSLLLLLEKNRSLD
jgi:hypothetical protein